MKTKKIKVRQGFTIVELVIVIGVIGVLSAVLIPTFINLNNKANEASNQAFVKNLNTQMAIREQEEGKNKTMAEAVEDAKDIGFDVEKLTPVNGRDLVWDSVSNRFLLLESNGDVWYGKEEKKATRDADIWKIYDAMPTTQKFSIYAKSNWATPSVAGLTVGFDAGSARINAVEYTGTQSVVINTKDDQCVVTINAPSADVDFYGFAKTMNVTAVKNESLHIFGAVNELAVTSGHVAVENSGVVLDVVQAGAADTGKGVTITNNGYVAKASLSKHTTDAAKGEAGKAVPASVGGDFQIGSREMLETFRNAVNAGNDFAEFDGTTKKVKLTADITLANGWTPIGEGNRKVVATNVEAAGTNRWFSGFFDGQGHKIRNLNNKGFRPNEERLTYVKNGTTKKQYAWGLFGLVNGTAKFQNVVIENVDFDKANYPDAEADSVAGLVGYAYGGISVSNVEVSGKLIGDDAVSGIVGRVTVKSGTVIINNCKNSASITADVAASGIVRLYDWAAGYSVSLTNNQNTGTLASIGNPNKVYTGGITVFTKSVFENAPATITHSGNTNHGNQVTVSQISGTNDNYKLD